MGNILGLSSDPYVIKQINLRQEKLGISNNIPDKILTWSHGNTAWLRLASSIDINGSSNQAKDNVLFGSTALWSPEREQTPENWLLTSGFNELNPRVSSYVSGSFGYRPKPGIMSADVSYLNNNGTLKKAKIKIKAYSPEQLELLDKLYMRLGYHVLLEWGHTIYINNDTQEIETFSTFNTKPFNEFFSNKTTPTKVLDTIKEEQQARFGNYEAFYGKIIKFNWSFKEDATYDIDLEIISQGDIVESLIVNSMATIPSDESNNTSTPSTGSVSVVSLKNTSAFNRFLYDIYKSPSTPIDSPPSSPPSTFDILLATIGTSLGGVAGGATGILTSILLSNISNKEKKPSIIDLTKIKNFYNIKTWYGSQGLGLPFLVENYFLGFDTNKLQYYVPLGFLLSYLEGNQNLFNQENDPYLFFDVSDENYCLTFDGSNSNNGPFHVSSDPRICIIPSTFSEYNAPGFNKFKTDENKNVGRVMYIHYNIEYITKLLFDIKNEKGKVFLNKFLNTLLEDTNRCLGGINKLTYKIKDDNTVYIVEEAPLLYGSLKPSSEPANFNIYGVRPSQGSFIRNIDFNVTITNDMATMITVGAQANGNQISQNATALSNFNIGLIDRTEEIRSPNNNTDKAEKEDNLKKQQEIIKKFSEAANALYYQSDSINTNNIENLINVNSDFANLVIGNQARLKQIPAPFFLPFDLNLTMMGLSGMKIFEKFTLTSESEKILPSIYRDNNGNSIIDFLIMDLSHTISNNKWETKIKGRTVPSENVVKQASPIFSSSIQQQQPQPQPSLTPSDVCPPISQNKEKALLDFISKYEGGTYNTINGGGKIPDLTSLSLDTILNDLQPKMKQVSDTTNTLVWRNQTYKGIKSSAVGKYQFINDTLQELVNSKQYNTKSTKFLPSTQDELVLFRLKNTRGLDRFLNGNLSIQDFSLNLAKEFASLPVLYTTKGHKLPNITRGQSFYAGDGKNKALHSADDFQKFLEQLNPNAPLGNQLTSLCKK